MDDAAFETIERTLSVRLPAEYRQVMGTLGDRLRGMTYRLNGEVTPYFTGENLYLTPEAVIAANASERQPGMGTRYAFPKWWETFVLVGTNGGGDYYSLRLDDGPGVWMIGSDCGSKPKLD